MSVVQLSAKNIPTHCWSHSILVVQPLLESSFFGVNPQFAGELLSFGGWSFELLVKIQETRSIQQQHPWTSRPTAIAFPLPSSRLAGCSLAGAAFLPAARKLVKVKSSDHDLRRHLKYLRRPIWSGVRIHDPKPPSCFKAMNFVPGCLGTSLQYAAERWQGWWRVQCKNHILSRDGCLHFFHYRSTATLQSNVDSILLV
jgi:hypothetical protein